MKRIRVPSVDEENARANVHARVFRCGSLPSLCSPSPSPDCPVELSERGEREREPDTRFHLCCLICCRCCRAYPPRLPCLLRVVRSFRICWIARRPFFLPLHSFFFLSFSFSFSQSRYLASRDRPRRRIMAARGHERKRVDFWRCA